mmetsp:Transcript_115613/g.230458  ORF Transcript_115613/g.230458 Transcript_115613/m.230458 type:complete len:293 (+) Transcript_115613:24-902(+)|eukprot:CAMPEP_0172800174 /NCGR_PEP_ID=MMETSP1075-20121228/2403_1 /TAXON_ID=2916 /ORGANISM="Ceratium fusus, Strain PA161109" /LENGTH=292 /DNA_ID=CAMNT_0013638033 /DNA_START=24 /DNA_END=902 /DNA_ORIENTATION=-
MALLPGAAFVALAIVAAHLDQVAADVVSTVPPLQLGAKIIRVACVGDSLTEGFHASDPGHSYPALLQGLLGSQYNVMNFGHSGATLTGPQAGYANKAPYWMTAAYQRSLTSEADIVVLMLGSNDATGRVWPRHRRQFAPLYVELVRAYLGMRSRPRVFLAVPPPLYRPHAYGGMLQSVINADLPRLIPQIAAKLGLPTISVFEAFRERCPNLHQNNCAYMSSTTTLRSHDDGCHPNDVGYFLIARKVQTAIAPDSLAASPPVAITPGDNTFYKRRLLAEVTHTSKQPITIFV